MENGKGKPTADTPPTARPLEKVPTRIEGVDYVLEGGLPKGRLTLLYGGPGAGKTIFGLEFLYRSALAGEPGIFVAFEERAAALRQNALTLGWDLAELEAQGRLFLLEARVNPEAVVAGEFNLQPLLAIIEGKARAMGATRIVIDAVDALLRLYEAPRQERRELLILSDWLNDNGFTSVVTAKLITDAETRYEFLDYLANTVIRLDQRVSEQASTRRLRITKYRGAGAGRDEYPFIIDRNGLVLIPITALKLDYQATPGVVASGHSELDAMLGGGYRKGSSVLVSGTSGTGKSILAATFTRAACDRGERVLYLNFEESVSMMLESLLSPGIDLRGHLQAGRLHILASSVEALGVEEHLVQAERALARFEPDHVVLDAASSAARLGSQQTAYGYLARLINRCRERGRTLMMTNQLAGTDTVQVISGVGISSLVDTVILLRLEESNGELNRTLLVLKSRGARHSNQAREFRITDRGIDILPPYIGEGGMVTGVARQQSEMREALEYQRLADHIRAKEAEIAHMSASLAAQRADLETAIDQASTELNAMRNELAAKQRGQEARREMRLPGTREGDTG